MKKVKNEKGMALVTVLLMITVFTILGMAVISLSISNTKQVTKTDGEMQAVDLAEMGVIYYKNTFISHANSQLRIAIEDAKQTINKLNADIMTANANNAQTDKDQELIPINETTILEYLDLEKVSFLPSVLKTITINENNSFKIDYHTEVINESNHNIQVDFKSIGYGPNDTKEITGTIKLNINEALISSYLGKGGAIITKPLGLEEKYVYGGQLEDGSSYTTSVYNSSTLDYDILGVTAVVNGSLQLNQSMKQIGKNSLLYITETADFGELNGNIDTSKLYVGGNADFGNINGGIKFNSILFIGGNATFGSVNGGVDDSSLVCVGGNIEGLEDNGNNIISQVTSPEAYQTKCLGRGSNSNDLSDEIANQVNKVTLVYH